MSSDDEEPPLVVDESAEMLSLQLATLARFARSKRQRRNLLEDILVQLETDKDGTARTVLAEYKGELSSGRKLKECMNGFLVCQSFW